MGPTSSELSMSYRKLFRALMKHKYNTLLKKGITWIFNPHTGSHHGGIWERQIRTIRWVLSAILDQQTLDDEGLKTLLCEVESIINDGPITKAWANDLEPLTLNHLLLLNTKLPYLLEYSRLVTFMSDKDGNIFNIWWTFFCKRWTKEYLPEPQEHQKWTHKHRNFVLRDIVLIIDDSTPQNSWILGQVTQATTDTRGLVRQVQVRTETTTLYRPITKLCLLLEPPV